MAKLFKGQSQSIFWGGLVAVLVFLSFCGCVFCAKVLKIRQKIKQDNAKTNKTSKTTNAKIKRLYYGVLGVVCIGYVLEVWGGMLSNKKRLARG